MVKSTKERTPGHPLISLERFQTYNNLYFRNITLLDMAITHRSFVNESGDLSTPDNERLEFLGDAILNWMTADMLFHRFPDASEGLLTRLRAALVRKESLAQFSQQVRLNEALRMGKGEEKIGGRARVNNLCDAFEALTGALYEDQGIEAVRRFVLPLMQERLTAVLEENSDSDARSLLQERIQIAYAVTPSYLINERVGADNQPLFHASVYVEDRLLGQGEGASKQAAAMNAAQHALHALYGSE
jgi:ribonuclease III